MTPDIHPHWTNTESNDPQKVEITEPTPPHPTTALPPSPRLRWAGRVNRVRISRKGHHSTFISNILFAIAGLTVLSFLFFQGLEFIKADVTANLRPDVVIEIDASGFPEAEVQPGQLVQFTNVGENPDQFRTEELGAGGEPLVEIPRIAPGESHFFEISEELAGVRLTFLSTFAPSRRGALIVGDAPAFRAVAAPQPPAPETPEPAPPVVTPTPTPTPPPVPTPTPPPVEPETTTVPEPEVQPPPTTSTPETVVPPPPPPPPPPPAPAKTINVGQEVARPVAATWPNRLKVNAFIVGSPLVPEFAPTSQLPVHIVRQTQQQMVQRSQQVRHAAGARPPARVQPATGPALWIVAFLALCSLPFFVEKRGKG